MFEKYQHLERLGKTEVNGILDGTCHVFPKLDGTNASIWWDGGVKCGSRKREITVDNDNHGFAAWVQEQPAIHKFLENNPKTRLYGEWLVPHTLKTYQNDAWRKFYVFDVVDDKGYVPYQMYKLLMFSYGIDYVPLLEQLHKPSQQDLQALLDKNTYLMQDGHIGEGIVIKNYKFVNRFGRTTWAKLVRSSFKEQSKVSKQPKTDREAESWIAKKYVTRSLIDKELAKFEPDFAGPIQGRLLSTIYHCILTEEIADAVKKLKNPTINFGNLRSEVIDRVKQLTPEHF